MAGSFCRLGGRDKRGIYLCWGTWLGAVVYRLQCPRDKRCCGWLGLMVYFNNIHAYNCNIWDNYLIEPWDVK